MGYGKGPPSLNEHHFIDPLTIPPKSGYPTHKTMAHVIREPKLKSDRGPTIEGFRLSKHKGNGPAVLDKWGFRYMGVPLNRCMIREHPIKLDGNPIMSLL